MKKFIEENTKFWEKLPKKPGQNRLLVESPSDLFFITHCISMQSLILNQANDLKPLWIENPNIPIDLLKSYVPSAEYMKLPKLGILNYIYLTVAMFLQFIKLFCTKKIISFKFDGIKYGDIAYDVFLSNYAVGTLNPNNQKTFFKLFKIMVRISKHHLIIRKAIKKLKITSVLSSHRIGLSGGVLVRAALRSRCKVYTNAGMHRNTLHVSRNRDEVIEYEYAPTKHEINELMNLPEDVFTDTYDKAVAFHMSGNAIRDAKLAFSADSTLYKTRDEFNKKYSLDSNKPNVFIMLHAFTDHPHSHFKSMLFNDYGDWFLKTLEFARKTDNVNWIFKRHPSDKFYEVKDINYNELFANTPDNVLLIGSDDKIDTRSLGTAADAIITCIGSAGFEIPAFYGIPAITAGDNHYMGYDFSFCPESQADYFELLKNVGTLNKLSAKAQKQAQAVYMFIYQFARVDYSFIPILSYDDHHDPEMNTTKFWKMVLDLYQKNEVKIYNEVAKYSFEVSRIDFKALRTKSLLSYNDYLHFDFDITQPMNENAIPVMKEGYTILENLGINACLADGTLLGVYRDKRLIPHDTDIDIEVMHPCDTDSIIREFTLKGYKIGRMVTIYGKVQQLVFHKHHILFDIIFYTQHGDSIYNFAEKDLYFKHSMKHYPATQKILFSDKEYYIPNDPEKWLANTYGADWKTPKSEKPKDWREGGTEYYAAHPYWQHNFEFFGHKTFQPPASNLKKVQEMEQDTIFKLINLAVTTAKKQGDSDLCGIELFCSDGFYSNYACQNGIKKMVGFDIDFNSHKQCLQQAAEMAELLNSNFELQKKPAEELNTNFDIGLCLDSLTSVNSPKKVLTHLRKYIKSALLIKVPVEASDIAPSKSTLKRQKDNAVWFNLNGLKKILADSGWEIITEESHDIFYDLRYSHCQSCYILCIPK